MSSPLRIASGASEVALRRAREVQAMLEARGIAANVVAIRTAGDRRLEDYAPNASTKAAFTAEIDRALAKGKADLGVHAYSDVPTEPAPGLKVAAVLRREDPREALVLNDRLEAESVADLPRGTTIGTSSVRGRCLLRALYPAIEVAHLRGDLPTRLRKVDDGQVHGTIVPVAALQRLGISQRTAIVLEPRAWLPAPAQGTTAIRVREDDHVACAAVDPLNDLRTAIDTAAERAFLGALEGGLQAPIGALVIDDEDGRALHGLIVDLDGNQILRGALPLEDSQPELIGVRLANDLRARGASRILDALRGAERIPAPQPDS